MNPFVLTSTGRRTIEFSELLNRFKTTVRNHGTCTEIKLCKVLCN